MHLNFFLLQGASEWSYLGPTILQQLNISLRPSRHWIVSQQKQFLANLLGFLLVSYSSTLARSIPVVQSLWDHWLTAANPASRFSASMFKKKWGWEKWKRCLGREDPKQNNPISSCRWKTKISCSCPQQKAKTDASELLWSHRKPHHCPHHCLNSFQHRRTKIQYHWTSFTVLALDVIMIPDCV